LSHLSQVLAGAAQARNVAMGRTDGRHRAILRSAFHGDAG
jgi:hypothetical protein